MMRGSSPFYFAYRYPKYDMRQISIECSREGRGGRTVSFKGWMRESN